MVISRKLIDTTTRFMTSIAGLISVVATMKDGAAVEVGMIGRDGMYSVSAILSGETPATTAVVQLAGHALRVKGKRHLKPALSPMR
jgi:hypothetical protein